MLDRPVPHVSLMASYNEIQAHMLSTQPHLEAAFSVNDRPVNTYEDNLDYSFTRQMGTLLRTSRDGTLPDVMLFTAESAIPIADAVRGFCYQQAVPVPVMSHVQSNFLVLLNLEREPKTARRDEQAEIKRLRKLAPHRNSTACVIDQYTWTGSTIRYAAQLAQKARFTPVMTVAGRWYMDARKQDIDKRRLTSRHRDFFFALGRQAAHDIQRTS